MRNAVGGDAFDPGVWDPSKGLLGSVTRDTLTAFQNRSSCSRVGSPSRRPCPWTRTVRLACLACCGTCPPSQQPPALPSAAVRPAAGRPVYLGVAYHEVHGGPGGCRKGWVTPSTCAPWRCLPQPVGRQGSFYRAWHTACTQYASAPGLRPCVPPPSLPAFLSLPIF